MVNTTGWSNPGEQKNCPVELLDKKLDAQIRGSLHHPNKQFQIKGKNISLSNLKTFGLYKFFIDNFGIDPPVINGDQIPVPKSESLMQKNSEL